MSPFFDQLEDQLRRAAQARVAERRAEAEGGAWADGGAGADAGAGAGAGAGGPSPTPGGRPRRRSRWSWLAAGLRSAPAIVAVVTTVVVVGAALAFLGHGSSPATQQPASSLPPGIAGMNPYTHLMSAWLHAPRQEARILDEAQNAALRVSGCRLANRSQGVTYISGTPSRALLSQLAVLRRPATGADHVPASALPGPERVYSGAARLALQAGGASYYLVPAQSDPAAGLPGPACFPAARAALRRLLPQLPAALRANAIKLQNDQLAAQRWMADRPVVDIVCLVVVGHNFGSSTCGENATQLRNGQVPQASGGGPQQGGTFSQAGIAPDGVATVTLTWATPGHHQVTMTAHVHDNIYVAASPPNGAMASMTWRAADGRQLKVIDAHTGADVSRLCRNRRSAKCIAALALVFSQGSSGSGSSYSYASSRSSSASQTTAAHASGTTTAP